MVVALATETPWTDWLGYWMDVRGFGSNKSKFAEYSHIDYSTVSAWFNRGTVPKPDKVKRVAEFLDRPLPEALRAAGYDLHEKPATEARREPEWIEALISELREAALTPGEARLVEGSLRGVLRFREERAAYDAPSPAEEPPGESPR